MGSEMEDRIALVTGGTGGIGQATAAGLARAGTHVVIGARNRERADIAVREIRDATGVAVDVVELDLARLSSVVAAAGDVQARFGALHVLVNNAGVMILGRRRVTVDGFELTFAVNHLGPFVLTTRLLDALRAGAPARIVTVSSDGYGIARDGLRWDDLQFEHDWSGWEAYGASKLCNVYFTLELARRLAGTGVTANVLHPGFVDTGLGRVRDEDRLPRARTTPPSDAPPARATTAPDLSTLGTPLSPEAGAATSLYLATSPDVANVSGVYFRDRAPAELSATAADPAAARRLWDISERLAARALARTS